MGSIIYLPDQTILLAVGLGVGILVLLGIMVTSGILINRKYFSSEKAQQPDRTERNFNEMVDIGPLPTMLTLPEDQGDLGHTGVTPRPDGYLTTDSGTHAERNDRDEQCESQRARQDTRRAVITMFPDEDTYFDMIDNTG